MVTSNAEMALYHYWRSSCSWRVRWALKHKGVPYQDYPINLLNNEQNSPSYLLKNPGGFVPAIEIAAGIFGESLAILEWIEETYSQRPLLPKSPADRLRVRQICHLIATGIQPIQNLSVMRKHSSLPSEQNDWAKHFITAGLTKLESLVLSCSGTYCFGDTVTMADLCLVPQIYNANRFGVDLSVFPTLSKINELCLKIPECEASAPHNQKGATT